MPKTELWPILRTGDDAPFLGIAANQADYPDTALRIHRAGKNEVQNPNHPPIDVIKYR